MADIFISYKREDIALAKSLAEVLIKAGYSVWWDHDIPAGKDYDQVIEEQLGSAKCVIVFWSAASVNSRNVKDEANEGLKRNVLIPVLIGNVRQPLGFRMIQAIQWNDNNTIEQSELDDLLGQLTPLIGNETQGNVTNIKLEKVIPSQNKQNLKPVDTTGGRKKEINFTSLLIIAVIAIAALTIVYFIRSSHSNKYHPNRDTNLTTQTNSDVPGKFPMASEKLLSGEDISGMNKWDLKIMRNEIFARHGFIFKTLDMKSYFSSQPWYKGTSDNVNDLLSPIEKQNVELIKKYE